jgi:putative ABC transport system permease protein
MAPNSQVLRILWTRFAWRHWRMSPVSSLLLLLILALGVAAFFSIRLANEAAVAGFASFTDLITSTSDGLITAPVGTLPDSVLTDLRQLLGNTPVNLVPILETSAVPPRRAENEGLGARPTFQILGLDLPALVNISGRAVGGGGLDATPSGTTNDDAADHTPVVQSPRAVFISTTLARRDHLVSGSPLPLVINDHLVTLKVAGLIPEIPTQPSAPASLLIMDLPALQELTDKIGQLDRVEFVLEPGPHRLEQWALIKQKLETANPPAAPRWLVSSSSARQKSGEVMTRAFRLNLTLLSLLALFVGLYLVFQGLHGAVVRRRNEIAILRSLGVTSGQIQGAWLVEAAVIGLLGGLVGLGFGWLGAQLAVKTVGQTMKSLYLAHTVDSAAFDFHEALIALAVAVAASVFAGWRPACLAANTPPAQIASRTPTSNDPAAEWLRRADLGFILIIAGSLLTFLPPWRLAGGGRIPVAAYACALCWIFGAGIFSGYILRGLGRFSAGLGRDSVPLRLACSHLRAPSGRHRLAAAGLVCAVGMTAGMAILVGSFDLTMRGWLARTFQADLYVTSDGDQTASAINRLAPATWQGIIGEPAVKRANVIQALEINIAGISTLLIGDDPRFFRDYAHPAWISAPPDEAVYDSARNAGLAVASESFSERFRVHRGDTIQVPVPGGKRAVTIAGVFADYGNERGSLLIERRQFTNWFGTQFAASVILALQPGRDPETLRARLRAAHPGLGVYTSGFLRGEALRIFRQTFAVTYALELIGVVVAVVGLAFTMSSLLWERRHDLATLRALGLRRRELAGAAALEGALLAAAGLIAGLAVSFGLGWLLIFRINKQTFGWTLQTNHPWGQLAILALLVLGTATLAGWLAGQWATRLPAEREE